MFEPSLSSFEHAVLQIDASPIFGVGVKGVDNVYGTIGKISVTAVAGTAPLLATEVQK